MQKLPGKLFELRELHRIDVSFNHLTILDDFAELTALRHLDASNNEFGALPPEMTVSLTLLEHLDLSHNAIVELPPNFGQLHRLRRLDLSHNDIAEFPNDRMDVLASVKVRVSTASPFAKIFIQLIKRSSSDGVVHVILLCR